MGITLDYQAARRRLEQAAELARSDSSLPEEWISRARRVRTLSSITFTPALGTGLLAKSLRQDVDALAIKEAYSASSYSARSLAHRVLVPAAQELGFDLRAKGREPLNNQPFFRYDHLNEVERVLNPVEFNYLRECLEAANQLTPEQAFLALAAFLRVCFESVKDAGAIELEGPLKGLPELVSMIEQFLAADTEGGKRAQAFVAAVMELAFPEEEVRTRRVNDPSRQFPGDVHVMVANTPIAAVEVRAKPVLPVEVTHFTSGLPEAGILRGILAVFADEHQALPSKELEDREWAERGVFLTIFESIAEMTRSAIAWSPLPLDLFLKRFPGVYARRLQELEVRENSLTRWIELCR